MPDSRHKPRVAVLGAREEDMEILAELQRQDQVTLVAVYDPDPHAPGLSLAEIAGVPSGADAAARERLASAEVIVLPTNRRAYQAAIDLVAEEVAAQVLDVLDGRPARYAVNAPLLSPEMARAIAPYLTLAQSIGRFFAQFCRTGISRLTVEIGGELAEHDTAPLTAAVLRGILETTTTERVNLVNAATLARSRGIAVVESRTPEAGAYSSLLSVAGDADGVRTAVAGTIANGESRIVRLNDYWVDMAPAPAMLVTRHQDRPGMIGRIGSLLGEADVNISAMHLARLAPREEALMVLALDEEVPAPVAAAIEALDDVLDVWTIRL